MVRKGEKLSKELRKKISKGCKARWDKDRTPRRTAVPVLVPHCPGCKTPTPPEGFVGKYGKPSKHCPKCLEYARDYYHAIRSGKRQTATERRDEVDYYVSHVWENLKPT